MGSRGSHLLRKGSMTWRTCLSPGQKSISGALVEVPYIIIPPWHVVRGTRTFEPVGTLPSGDHSTQKMFIKIVKVFLMQGNIDYYR